MTFHSDAVQAPTAEAPSDRRELDLLRRTSRSFHVRLAATLPAVERLASHNLQLWDVARSLTAAMVTVQLLISVLGDADTVEVALFEGPVAEPRPGEDGPASGDDNRAEWEQLWALRRSAVNFSGRLNRCRFFAVPFGLTVIQRRVAITTLLAVGRMIEAIGSLRVPDQFYEFVH